MIDDPMKCACRSLDPRECMRLRYPGYYGDGLDTDPATLDAMEMDERCECCCHQEYYDQVASDYENAL